MDLIYWNQATKQYIIWKHNKSQNFYYYKLQSTTSSNNLPLIKILFKIYHFVDKIRFDVFYQYILIILWEKMKFSYEFW